VIEKEPTGRYAARAHYARGLIYDELGRYFDAQVDYVKAVELDPENIAARQKIDSRTLTERTFDPFYVNPKTPASSPVSSPSAPQPQTPPVRPSPASSPSSEEQRKKLEEVALSVYSKMVGVTGTPSSAPSPTPQPKAEIPKPTSAQPVMAAAPKPTPTPAAKPAEQPNPQSKPPDPQDLAGVSRRSHRERR